MFEFAVGAGCLIFSSILFVSSRVIEHIQHIQMTAFK